MDHMRSAGEVGGALDVIKPEIVLVAAPDRAFRRSLEFALESAGFQTEAHVYVSNAFASQVANGAVCAVVDDHAVDNWPLLPEQLRLFGRPVVLVAGRFPDTPTLPSVTLVMKPFLGKPLIDAVRNAITGVKGHVAT